MASENVKLIVHTSKPKAEHPTANSPRRMRIKTRLSFQERLLRNSFLACAVLLGVLALGNLNQPWAVKAVSNIQQALTMTIDLDESLGGLTFVRKLMPESAQVFFNLNNTANTMLPIHGELKHNYSGAQPWLLFAVSEQEEVCAIRDGTISAVSELSDGSLGILIDHGEGLESVLAGLSELCVESGDSVQAGTPIGSCHTSLYFELRQGGKPIDPSEYLGL